MEACLIRIEALEKRVATQEAQISILTAKKKPESYYQRLVEDILQGHHLHIPGVGRTDVTTSEQHAEVKRWSRYHEVLGQLAKYQQGAPRTKLAVYFFGPRPKDQRIRDIENTMRNHRIHMYSFEDNSNDTLIDHCQTDLRNEPGLETLLERWLESNIEKSEKGVHLHRVKLSFKMYLQSIDRLQSMPSDSTLRTIFKTRGFTFAIPRKRDRDCECGNNALTLAGITLR